jgi:ATP-binding cassette, subfamily B, bacterial HlyB/CyaB
VARLVELAGEFGLRAERLRLDWEGLRNTPFSHPILLLLDNKNAVVLVGVRRNGPEEVAVSDPVFRDGEPFFLAREDLERAWRGAARRSRSPRCRRARRTPPLASLGSQPSCLPSAA